MTRYLLSLVSAGAVAALAAAGNWPAWRGPDGMGHCPEKGLPLTWSPTENVRWKVPLPDDGNSTPAVWGDRVFLTQAIGKGAMSRRLVMCLQRSDGKLLWQKETVYPEAETTHNTNPYCSASPVTDGERVVASLGSAGLVCYDFDGNELWRRDVGKMDHIWGNASSPIIYQDLAILWVGPGENQVLLALDKKTGKTVWEHKEEGGHSGRGGGSANWIGSWSTPIIASVDGQDQLILSVPRKVKGFDPRTGKELWFCDGLGPLVYTSPVYGNGVVVAMAGYGGAALAVRIDDNARGDLTATRRLWHMTRKNPQRIGSPVIVGDHLYLVNEPGAAVCYELKTGKEVWQRDERVTGTTWSSLVATADGRLYLNSHAGDTVVLAASPQFELLARNPLGERTLSSVAVADGELFIRTYKHLWCIGSR